MIRHYEIFADYFQFYLWDRERGPEALVDYTDADCKARIKAAPFVVVVMPERNMTVPVTLEVMDRAPEPDVADWDHVTEATLELPSGQLEIHECTGGSIDRLSLEPGTYRIRSHHAGLGTLSPDGLEGEDRYRIVLWPAPPDKVAILKAFNEDTPPS